MITIEQIKNIAKDIKEDKEWVNDSHTNSEHRGVISGLDSLIRHLQEIKKDDISELDWWRSYGEYVSARATIIDAEACGYADGDDEYVEDNELSDDIMEQIWEIESYGFHTQEDEDCHIERLNYLYNILHQLYDTPAKQSHDKTEGKDYYVVECDGKLIFKHKTSGFAPRLK